MDYFYNIDWMQLLKHLTIPTIILVISFTVGVSLNSMLQRKVDRHVKGDEGRIKNIFFRALQGVPISLCMVIGLYWIVTTSQLPSGLMTFFSYGTPN